MKKTMLLFTIAAIMASCNSEQKKGSDEQKKDTMSETKTERNKKVVMASMSAFAKRDIDGMVKDAAPGYIDYGDETMPPSNNLDSTKVFIKMLLNSFEDFQ